ncbi:MAG: GTPase Era [Chloroflexi bacterium]|nr:GTPase Era [Chloroflexota bacterium]
MMNEQETINASDAISEVTQGHRSGYVAVVGKPNVGKSTLVNALVGHKVAIVSPKPQTTRRRIMGILTREDAQVIFVDTPGIHDPKHALNKYMMHEVENALSDCDAILFVVDVSTPPDESDQRVAQRIRKMPQPKIMALNKADLIDPLNVVEYTRLYHELFGSEDSMLTSGVDVRVENLNELTAMLVAQLLEGPEFYPPEQYTDQPEKILAAELIREQALHFLEQEVPHAVAVSVDEYALRPNNTTYISATIYVERDSQKGILIGRSGQMLKRIGMESRREIERILGNKVYLELWVKVREAWRRDEGAVNELLGSSV